MNPLIQKTKRLGYALTLLSIIGIGACNLPTNTTTVSFGGPKNLFFIDPDMISKAQKLAKTYPEEEFYGLSSEVKVEFYMPEAEKEEKSSERSRSRKDKEEESDKEEDDEKDAMSADDSLMTTKVKARVTYYNTVLSLKDRNEFVEAIGYNNQQKVKDIMVSYNEADEDWFYPVVIDQSLDGDGIFYSDARIKGFSAVAPTLGTQISYIYTVEYDNVNYLTDVYFPEHFPIDKKNVTFVIPDWMNVDLLERNLKSFNINRMDENIRKSKIDEIKKTLSNQDDDEDEDEPKSKRRRRRSKRKSASKKSSFSYVNFEAKDLPGAKNEYKATGPSYNLPHILILSKSFKNEKGEEEHILSDLNDLYAWYRTLVKGVDNDSAEMKKKADEIVEGASTNKEKVEKIFYWVQDNIRYIAYEDGVAGFRPDACQKVLKNRFGDCKGMANLTAQLLRAEGFDARLTWIGTNRIAYDYTIPSIAVDNHMICTVILDGKRYFLDATEPYCALGDNGHRIQGRPVLIEDGDSYIIDSIPNFSYQRNKNLKEEKLKLVKDELVGKVKESYSGESKTYLLYSFNNIKSDRKQTSMERFLSNRDVNLKVSNINHTELDVRDKPIDFNYDLTVNNRVLTNQKDVLINLEWDGHFSGLELDSTRLRDYELKAKEYHAKNTELDLGAKAKAKHLPDPVKIENPYFTINLSYELKGNKLLYKKELIFPHARIPKSEFKAWNEARKKIEAFYNDYAIITLN